MRATLGVEDEGLIGAKQSRCQRVEREMLGCRDVIGLVFLDRAHVEHAKAGTAILDPLRQLQRGDVILLALNVLRERRDVDARVMHRIRTSDEWRENAQAHSHRSEPVRGAGSRAAERAIDHAVDGRAFRLSSHSAIRKPAMAKSTTMSTTTPYGARSNDGSVKVPRGVDS